MRETSCGETIQIIVFQESELQTSFVKSNYGTRPDLGQREGIPEDPRRRAAFRPPHGTAPLGSGQRPAPVAPDPVRAVQGRTEDPAAQGPSGPGEGAGTERSAAARAEGEERGG